MFEDGARLDDIMNIFKPPTLDDDENKKNKPVSEAGIRYFSRKDIANDNFKLNFQGNFQGNFDSEVLK